MEKQEDYHCGTQHCKARGLSCASESARSKPSKPSANSCYRPAITRFGIRSFLEQSRAAISAEDLLFDTLTKDIDSGSVGDLARLGAEAKALVSTIGDSTLQRRIVSRLDQVTGT